MNIPYKRDDHYNHIIELIFIFTSVGKCKRQYIKEWLLKMRCPCILPAGTEPDFDADSKLESEKYSQQNISIISGFYNKSES